MASKPKEGLTITPSNAPVELTLRDDGQALYVIAANKSPKPQSVRFAGKALDGKQAKVLFETHPVEVKSGTLADKFEGFGVHIYRIAKK